MTYRTTQFVGTMNKKMNINTPNIVGECNKKGREEIFKRRESLSRTPTGKRKGTKNADVSMRGTSTNENNITNQKNKEGDEVFYEAGKKEQELSRDA